MNLLEIVNNYKNYKKVKHRISKLKKFEPRRGILTAVSLSAGISLILSMFISVYLSTILGIGLSLLICVVIYFLFAIVGLCLLNSQHENKINKIKNLNNILEKKLKFSYFFNKKKVEKLNKVYNFCFEKSDEKSIKNIQLIEKKIRRKYEKKFIQENNDNYKNKSKLELKACAYSTEMKIKMFHIIEHIFENIEIKDLEKISDEKLEELLSDLSMEEKIELTNKFKKKLKIEKIKIKEVNENLEVIKNLGNNYEKLSLEKEELSFN